MHSGGLPYRRRGVFLLLWLALVAALPTHAAPEDCDSYFQIFAGFSEPLRRFAARGPREVTFQELARAIREGEPGEFDVNENGIRFGLYIDEVNGTLFITFGAIRAGNLLPRESRGGGGGLSFLVAMYDIVRATAERVANYPDSDRPRRIVFQANSVMHPQLRDIVERLGLRPMPNAYDNHPIRAQLHRLAVLMRVPSIVRELNRMEGNERSTWQNFLWAMSAVWDAPNMRSFRVEITLPLPRRDWGTPRFPPR